METGPVNHIAKELSAIRSLSNFRNRNDNPHLAADEPFAKTMKLVLSDGKKVSRQFRFIP
jgi:hypothetical protein